MPELTLDGDFAYPAFCQINLNDEYKDQKLQHSPSDLLEHIHCNTIWVHETKGGKLISSFISSGLRLWSIKLSVFNSAERIVILKLCYLSGLPTYAIERSITKRRILSFSGM